LNNGIVSSENTIPLTSIIFMFWHSV